ncbi:MAG: CapA family protein [Clostridia bacterium]|nr:CapA family protein [Clostridia bacterium]
MAQRYYPHGKLKAFLKVIIILLVIIIINCFRIIIVNFKSNINIKSIDGKSIQIDSVTREVEIPDDITINLAVIGDIMCHNTQYMDAYKDGIYDFSYVFDDIREELKKADISVGNLETTFAGKDRGYSSYPSFNTPESLAWAIKDAGIDLLSTANNHSLDTGYTGLESTINYLDEAEILHTGTYKSQETQNQTTIVEVKGVKIAFLSFTYGTNGIPIPEGREYCINLINDDFIINRLNLAKEQNPDIICVFMHWGEEYETTPNSEQQRLVKLLFENGTNIILGSHPHVLQKMEKVDFEYDGKLSEGFVIYSLGNFVSGQNKDNTRNSIILKLSITKKGTGEIVVDSANYVPIYTYRGNTDIKKYKVLNIFKALENYNSGNQYITSSDYDLLTSEYNKIISTVGPAY